MYRGKNPNCNENVKEDTEEKQILRQKSQPRFVIGLPYMKVLQAFLENLKCI